MLVYSLVNQVNGKSYIGQTGSYNLNKRWNRRLGNKASNVHLSASIRRYGPEAFRRTVLAACASQLELDALERFWITVRQSTDPAWGYNQQLGGLSGPGRHTARVKQRISVRAKQVWEQRTPEWRAGFAATVRANTEAWWRNRTEAERRAFGEKIRQRLMGRKGHPAWNRGLSPAPNAGVPRPPKSDETRKKISEGLLLYYRRRREKMQKKPSGSVRTGTQYQRQLESPANRKHSRASPVLKVVPSQRTEQRFTVVIQDIRQQLRAVEQRLHRLEQEFRGNCNW